MSTPSPHKKSKRNATALTALQQQTGYWPQHTQQQQQHHTLHSTPTQHTSSPQFEQDDTENPLGPPWSTQEVTEFFNCVKRHKPEWRTVIKRFPARTEEMLDHLYQVTSNEISECNSADNFIFVVKGVYAAMVPKKAPGSSSKYHLPMTRRSADTGASPSSHLLHHHQPQQQHQQQHQPIIQQQQQQQQQQKQPGYSTRGRKLPFSEPIKNSSSSSSDHHSTTTTTTTTSSSQSPSSATKKRKSSSTSTTSTPLKSSYEDEVMSSPSSLPAKLRTKINKSKPSTPLQDENGAYGLLSMSHSPTNSAYNKPHQQQQQQQQLITSSPRSLAESQLTIQKRLQNFLGKRTSEPAATAGSQQQQQHQHQQQQGYELSRSGKWAMYEWFYSDIDAPFYFYNEFQMWLNQIGIGKVRKLSKIEWNEVRSRMKKPRRLSEVFFQEAREKLYQTREKIRQSMLHDDIFKFLQIQPNSKVLYHLNNSLQRGTVLYYSFDNMCYEIENDKTKLPVTVPDTDVMSIDKNIRSIIESNFIYANKDNNNNNNSINNNSNLNNSTATNQSMMSDQEQQTNDQLEKTPLILVLGLIVVLEKKEGLIAQLTELNTQAEKIILDGYPKHFQIEYSRVLVNLEYLNKVLKTLLEIFKRDQSTHVSDPNTTTTLMTNTPTSQTQLNTSHIKQQYLITDLVNLIRDQSKSFITKIVKDNNNNLDYRPNRVLERDEQLMKLAHGCVSMMYALRQACSNTDLSEHDIAYLFDSCLAQVKPTSPENAALFEQIQSTVIRLRDRIVATPTST
ncbi:hypothetical protein SAMD00019534_115580 [Acytostelium subglobosum LB1]|uniref:hypothetical protein n=1 Tax=Acytostelium subglobosum LB1 TaxID=1410327 RepID=UPI0006451A1B|nr:hypothetical protein SAMD00019534_115580 [Acytostelium subglobosum LB1]GAM28382.1 hypothetical protein SAMD00019534_115580 [Acytostelium subglobosum LB1]|eukprot:XP_012748699.1 hypothetical protein SAMD00019534_115580 [Acytostelium subglobosum LB1]